MTERQRELLAQLAADARYVAEEARDPEEPLSAEAWVVLDHLADDLSQLEHELTLDALAA